MKLRLMIGALCAVAPLLGTACTDNNLVGPSARTDRGSLFDALWKEFDLRYSYFDIRGVDWNAMNDKYRPQAVAATTDQQFASVLGQMLNELHDVHVSITPSGSSTSIRYISQYERSAIGFDAPTSFARYAKSSFTTTGGHIRAGLASAGVGYVQIPTFADDGWEGEIDEAIRKLGSISSLIIDVRNNGGGSKQLGTSIAGRFADRERTFGYVRLRNGPKHDDFTAEIGENVKPEGTHFSGRVIVLANRRSMSSAEDFVLAMHAIPGVTIMGDTTAGASGGPLVRELANGWTYQLSQWQAFTAEHKRFEGIGLAPDVVVKPTAEAMRSAITATDAPLERAIGTLSGK